MFQAKRWKRLFPTLVFFTAYSLLFLLWKETFLYSLPLALGFLLAWAVQPAVSFLSRRLGLSRGAAALRPREPLWPQAWALRAFWDFGPFGRPLSL